MPVSKRPPNHACGMTIAAGGLGLAGLALYAWEPKPHPMTPPCLLNNRTSWAECARMIYSAGYRVLLLPFDR
jgi:hypothetical protein